ncbi:MAG: hypothetical protein KDE26_25810, partial [Bacteroidetes bacterium]|nr:hypothetical protein [Bacteroidota bacterium]
DVVKVIGLNQGAIFQPVGQDNLYFWQGDSLTEYNPAQNLGMQSLGYYYGSLRGFSTTLGLIEWDGQQFRQVPGGENLIGKKIVEMVPFPGKKLLARSLNEGFFLFSPPGLPLEIQPFHTEIDDAIEGNMFSKLIPINENQFLVGTVKNGGYLINHQGKLLMQINETSGLQDNLILGGIQDEGKSLWLTLSKGISRVEISSPVSYWDDAAGLRGIVYSSIRHQGILYASTPLGVYFLEEGKFSPVQGLGIESWKLFPFEINHPNGKKEEKLLVATVRGLYEIKHKKAILLNRNLKLVNIYQSPFQAQRIYNISGSEGVQVIDYRNGKWENPKQIKQLDGRYKGIAEDREGNLWLVELYDRGGLVRVEFSDREKLKVSNITHFQEKFDLPTMLSIFHLDDALIFSSTSGLIRYDYVQNHFYSDTILNLSPRNGAVTKLVKDYQDQIWLERQKNTRSWVEILKKDPDGRYQRDTTMLKGLDNTEVWGNIYPEPNGLIWIGTTEGLFVFNKNIQRNFSQMATPIVREVVLAEDSVLFFGGFPALLKPDSIQQSSDVMGFWEETPEISYKLNSITFHYSAPYFEDEKGIQYSYFLKGFDQEWSSWNLVHKKDYNSLPPGKYEFQVRAKNVYGQISETAYFPFKISPPWYRTYWAFISYGFLVVFLIYGTVKLNTQRLHLQNEHLERIVYERTAEIWEQHKEIVKKTVALKRQKEEIATQHDLLEEKNEALEATLKQLKDAQSQLVESEKMASLGQLTAGIAHEINNPINYVKGNISPLKRDFSELKPLL